MANLNSNPREQKRLRKELADIQSEADKEDCGVNAQMVDCDIFCWNGFIDGPKGTPYEGGRFMLEIIVPSEYPYNPPKIRFITKIWHPNISSQTGAICLDILKNEWSPALTIRTALLSIQALLSAPEPDDPQDAQVASMYKKDFQEFNQRAALWARMFAMGNESTQEEKVKTVMEIGFTEQQARSSLMSHNWDETAALNSLLEDS